MNRNVGAGLDESIHAFSPARPVSIRRPIGILGGTFDPIHYGHLVIAEEVRATLDLAEMVFLPAGQPPHKPGKIVTAVEHRLAMLQLAIGSNPGFTISLVDVERPGPSYTVDTLRLLHEQWGNQCVGARQPRPGDDEGSVLAPALYFVIGGDSLEDFLTWRDPAGILNQLAALVAVMRPGYLERNAEQYYREKLEARLPGIKERLILVAAPQLNISATDLRRRVAEGRPIKYQTPEAVERYIYKHGLYRQQPEM